MTQPKAIKSLFVSCAGLVLAAALAGPASADSIRAIYSVTLIGLPIGTASAIGSINGSTYKIDVNAKLSGIAAIVSNSKAAMVASGNFGKTGALPSTYATTSSNDKETRTVRMALTAGNVKAVEISPPIPEAPEPRIDVTDAHKRNILDPVSALIMQVPAGQPLVGPTACNRTIPIFDGYTRFDLQLNYVGTRNVKTKGYSGPVSVCTARYVPVSGHRPARRTTQFMANNKQIEAWLAPVEGNHIVVPFHVSILTQAGTAVIDATEFTIQQSQAEAGR